jgi:hypothetical protein
MRKIPWTKASQLRGFGEKLFSPFSPQLRANCRNDLKHKGTQTARETHILREEKGRFGTLCNTTAWPQTAFVISRSSVRIRKAAPKRELADAIMASVLCLLDRGHSKAFLMTEKGYDFFLIFYFFVYLNNKYRFQRDENVKNVHLKTLVEGNSFLLAKAVALTQLSTLMTFE